MKPFDNPKVRKALNMAINKQAIIDAVFQGTGKIAKNPIPPTMWSYNESTVDDPYDPDAAKKMLADAGVTGSEDEDLGDAGAAALQPECPPHGRADPGRLRQGRRQGRDRLLSSGASTSSASSDIDRDGAVLLGWTGDNGDPDNFLAVLLGCDAVGGNNRAQWCYKPFDDLIQKAKGPSDQDERDQALRAGADDLQGAGAVGDHRPLARRPCRWRKDVTGFVDGSARPPQLRRRRHRRVVD